MAEEMMEETMVFMTLDMKKRENARKIEKIIQDSEYMCEIRSCKYKV